VISDVLFKVPVREAVTKLGPAEVFSDWGAPGQCWYQDVNSAVSNKSLEEWSVVLAAPKKST
jgi:hypothetical protein